MATLQGRAASWNTAVSQQRVDKEAGQGFRGEGGIVVDQVLGHVSVSLGDTGLGV